jgi:DNA-directed RNA polymerase subunit RPC12/RpoP
MKATKVYFRCSDCGERTKYGMELDNGKIICPGCDTKRLINSKPKSLKR